MAKAAVAEPAPRAGSLVHSVGGLVMLLVVVILSVFNPAA